ncbi:hypothetical protein, partial [Phaeobacter inhibens]|uniref:hypothetical protein n=1 Tax=Phaeobacter inhibens TaxID=221822 RepID=UPI0039F0619F
GQTFTPVPSGVEVDLQEAIVDGQHILLFGAPNPLSLVTEDALRSGNFGAHAEITRSTDGGQTFTPVPSGVEAHFQEAIVEGQNILLFGGHSAISLIRGDGSRQAPITLSTDGGQTFTPVPSGVEGNLLEAIVEGQNILLFGGNGSIVSVDKRYSEKLSVANLENGTAGDILLAQFIDGELPIHLRALPAIADARASLFSIEARRGVLSTLEHETLDKLNRLRDAPALLKREEIHQNYEDFLNLCRGAKSDADLTRACLDSWRSERESGKQNWWQALAVQVPPGILLLFLLSTLGALYRYSLRMSGFYHSRADALELLHAGLDEKQLASLTALATDLAADKVEFGKGNAPTDQAVELAKAMAGKV